MHVSPSCYIVLTVFHSVTEDDVRNIETCLLIEECRNLLKNHDLLCAVSTFCSLLGLI